MKSNSCFLAIFFTATMLLFHSCNQPDTTIQVTNPLSLIDGSPVVMGDPFILHASDGNFYAYGTTEGNMDGFNVYVSEDLTRWKLAGQCYKADPDGWTTDCFWAPEVYERNGKFYMLFSSNWKENPTNEGEIFRIGVAVSDSPTGPFKELSDKPIFDPGYPIIDANLYFAEDGRVYLYYSRCCYKHAVESELATQMKDVGKYEEIEESWIYGVEIKPDFSGAIGDPVQLLVPPYELGGAQEWESRSAMAGEANRRWNEGSFIFKHGDTYYIMYSANFYGGPYYAVGYATGKSPLGPFTKAANNPVLERNNDKGGEVYCTGHNMVLTMPDGTLYTVYHGRTERTDAVTNNGRVMFIDKMEILPDGQLIVHGPTTEAQSINVE